MSIKQTLLGNVIKCFLLTIILWFTVIGYIVAVSNMIRYSRPEDGNPAMMIGWGAVSVMLFIAIIIDMIVAIRIMPNKK